MSYSFQWIAPNRQRCVTRFSYLSAADLESNILNHLVSIFSTRNGIRSLKKKVDQLMNRGSSATNTSLFLIRQIGGNYCALSTHDLPHWSYVCTLVCLSLVVSSPVLNPSKLVIYAGRCGLERRSRFFVLFVCLRPWFCHPCVVFSSLFPFVLVVPSCATEWVILLLLPNLTFIRVFCRVIIGLDSSLLLNVPNSIVLLRLIL